MDPLAPTIAGDAASARYAAALLARLGIRAQSGHASDAPDEPTPAALWARSGAMALTGHAGGPPLPAPGPLAACAEGALRALRALAPQAPLPRDGAALLGEHAACFGYTRRGRTSAGGSCRLLRCADGWVALNLARPADAAALPALFECDAAPDAWTLAERELARRPGREWVERARLLSLPLAAAQAPAPRAPDWLCSQTLGERLRPAAAAPGPLLLDLSSLWAGPLCTSLLSDAGARVLKLESAGRPDGVRNGNARLFDLLHAGKRSLALDFATPDGRRALHALIERADVVIEATRPRALLQLGVDAQAWLAARPGRVWLSLTGYGRGDAAPGRVAFGDDAAVAAGLATATGAAEGAPLFCADAIADPLAGLHAALAVWAAWQQGGGVLLDLSLCDVAAHALGFATPPGDCDEPAAPPRARPPRGRARAFGADTRAVLRELAIAC